MSNPLLLGKDLGDLIIPVSASAFATATAGGTGDDTLVVGSTIDRFNLVPNGLKGTISGVVPFGGTFLLAYSAVLAAAKTLSIVAATVQDSADGTNWTTIYDITGAAAPIPPTWPAAGVFDTGAAGGSTQHGVITFSTDIKKAREFVRFSFTPDLSNTSTDTLSIVALAVLSGIDEVPPGVF